jgi:general secretion pathway protein A
MYTQFFRLTQAPFSISPDPRYLFMSERHREALAHLLYGIDSGGGLVLLTGDIGTGKTTICRCFLEQVPANCNVAYIFNPKLTVAELLQSVCEEFHVEAPPGMSAKDHIDALNRFLLREHAAGRNNVLVIDEAQNLSADVLEQLRLLTNLETNERKLLQIILIGQPELRAMLSRPELEQLAQRVIAHYHLTALSEPETACYIQHRLATAGLNTASPFAPPLMKQIHRLTAGVPRRINLLCDRALLGAYARSRDTVDRRIVEEAASELFINQRTSAAPRWQRRMSVLLLFAGVLTIATGAWIVIVHPPFKRMPAQASVAEPEPARVEPVAMATNRNLVLRAGLPSETDALRELTQLWGVPNVGDPCLAADAHLRCYRGKGGLTELRQLDRPAVLTLYDHAGKPFYALLTGVGNGVVSLRAGAASEEVGLTILARHFRGEYVLLWRAPPGFGDIVKLGASGPAADWFAAQLALLNGVRAPAPRQPFSQQAQAQVRLFQQTRGLLVDGTIGPVTAMHLNRAAGIDEPQLRSIATE